MIRAFKSCAWALTGIALANSATVLAQGQCPAVRAIISGESKALEGVGISINANGRTDLTKLGTAGPVRDAESCDLSSDQTSFDISCDWVFSGEQRRQAERTFDRLRRGLENCLPRPLEKQPPPKPYTDAKLEEVRQQYGDSFIAYLRNNEILKDYELEIELSDGDSIGIDLRMRRAKDTGRTRIDVGFYR